jgi:hypothetical protein
MKTFTSLALAAVLISSPFASASEGQGKGRHQQRAAHMQEKFGVTDEQLAEMHRIRQEGGSREEIRQVLTEDQRRQMKEWRENNPGGRHSGGGHSRGAPGGAEEQ